MMSGLALGRAECLPSCSGRRQAEDAGWRSLGRPAGRAWRAAPPRRRGYALKAVQGKTGGDDWEMTPFLYEPKYGLPVVRETVDMGALLHDIRHERVSRIYWYTKTNVDVIDGPCLVIYKDGTLKQSYVPTHAGAMRIFYAMETHGVMGQKLKEQPVPSMTTPTWRPSKAQMDIFTKTIPAVALAGVLAAAKYAAWRKGDADDRALLRKRAAEKRAQERREARALEFRLEIEEMALDPTTTVDDILKHLSLYREEEARIPREEVESIFQVAREKGPSDELKDMQARRSGTYVATEAKAKAQRDAAEERAARRREEEGEMDDVEKGKRFGRMNTTRVTKAKTKAAARRRLKLQHADDDRPVLFEDVAGLGDAKEEVVEVVDFFRNPEKFIKSGARVPRGVLLCGPPGTGKTLLARAVAGEAGVDFLCVNASEFVEMFVGVGASRVRDLFNTAKKLAPCIVFIDEIDAVGRVRGGAKGNDERDQTLNQMLSCMDGFDSQSDVIVMAATNRKDVLDPALIRPGRFDRIIFVDRPDFEGRIEIFNVHLRGKPHEGLDLRELAFVTQQFSGAMIANLINMAAILAARAGREVITQADMFDALDYERLGAPRPIQSLSQRRRLGVQEAATALVASLMPAIEPVEKCTVVPREKFPLGHTTLAVDEARELTRMWTRRYLREQMMVELAGRAAEDLIYGAENLSTINHGRLCKARDIATKLVVAEAMEGDALVGTLPLAAPLHQGDRQLILEVSPTMTMDTHNRADRAMGRILDETYKQVRELLSRNRAALEALEEALMMQGTLTGDEVLEVVRARADATDLKKMDEVDRMEVFM